MITNSKRSLILKLSFRRILKVVSQLNKPQIFLKYCFSRERQFEFTNPRFGNCVNSSKYINTCVLNTFIFILTGQRLFDAYRVHFPIVKQELTKRFWPWKYTHLAVTLVKSVNVHQNTFHICGYQNQIIPIWLERFDHDYNFLRPPVDKVGA